MNKRNNILILVLALTGSLSAGALDFEPDASGSRFISSSVPGRVSLEFRDEAQVSGATVKLKDVVRCSSADAMALDLTLEIPIGKMPATGKLGLNVSDVKKAMEDHGISLLGIHFSGAASCEVGRLQNAVAEAPKASEKADFKTEHPAVSSNIPALNALSPAENKAPGKTLKELLVQNVADRLGLDPEDLVLTFKTEDRKYSDLSETECEFSFAPNKLSNLGNVAWDVTLKTREGEKRVLVSGMVQAWRTQIKAVKPLGFRQPLTKDDVKETRILTDRLADSQGLSIDQILGSETTRAISPGEVIAPSSIQASVLVKTGQLITVTVRRGALEIKWVAEARQNGSWGDVIRVRRPGTREEFPVRLTGREQGDLMDGNEIATR